MTPMSSPPNITFSATAKWAADGLKRLMEYFPIGIGGVFSFFNNWFGDANALVRRSVFEELGGFTEEYGVGFEDWELFLKAYMRGKRMGVVPEPLFNYRASGTGMLGSGNALLDHERIYRAMEEYKPRLGADILRLAARNHLSQVVLDRTWELLGRSRQGDLLQQMMAMEPNSPEALAKLGELAMAFGRLPDALEIGAKTMDSRETMARLLRDPAVARRMRSSFELVALEPTQAEDAIFLEGWAIDADGAPLALPVVWAAGRWLTVAGLRREPRHDVKESCRLASERDLGFRLIAMTGAPDKSGASVAKSRGLFGLSLGKAGGQVQSAQRLGFRLGDLECGLPAGPGWRGHIDRGGWQRAAKIVLPDSYVQRPMVEVETSVACDPVIVWGDGAIDWGQRATDKRVRFFREKKLESNEITLITPNSALTHVVVS